MAVLSSQAPPPVEAPRPPRRWPLYVVLAVVLAIVVAAYASGATHYLSLDELGRRHAELKTYVHAHPAGSLLIYAGVYLASVVLFLPAMTLLLLAGGFLFGVPAAAAAALCMALIGAAATFLLARSTLGATLRRRIKTGGLVSAMESGASRHAFSYLLTLRMVPIFPFGVVNVVAGLVKMPLSVFCAATFLGLLPPALVYTALGVGLSQVFDRGEHVDMATFAKPAIVGPLLGLAALSLIPHLYRAWRAKSPAAKT